MEQPKLIFKLIPKAIEKIGAVGKDGVNTHQNYKFRSIDDMYNKIQPVLSELGLFFIPIVLETKEDIFETLKKTQYGEQTSRSIRVKQKIKYTICASDGSSIDAIIEGEAIDTSDKATNKAMTAAFKYMLIQVFCLAVSDTDDADKTSPEISTFKEKKIENHNIRDSKKTSPVIKKEEIKNLPIEKEQIKETPIATEVERLPDKTKLMISKYQADFLKTTGFKFGYKLDEISHVIYNLTKKIRWSELNNEEFEFILQYLADNRKG